MEKFRPAFELSRIDQTEKVPKRASRKVTVISSKTPVTPIAPADQGDLWPDALLAEAVLVDTRTQSVTATKKTLSAHKELPSPPHRI